MTERSEALLHLMHAARTCLSDEQRNEVGAVFADYPERAAALLSAFGGTTLTHAEAAALVLRLARRIAHERGGAAS